MKIATLNIWDLPLWFVKDRKERLARIIAYINTLDADIICFQESFDPRHRSALNASFTAYQSSDPFPRQRNVFFISFDTTGGCVTFSKFPILKTSFIKFRKSFFSIEFFSGKGALIIHINTPHGVLRIVNTHLHKKSFFFDRIIRLQQMKHIFAYLRLDGSLPTILAGDFNEHNMVYNSQFSALIQDERFFHPKTDTWNPTYRKNNLYVTICMNMVSYSKRIDYILHKDLMLLGMRSGHYDVSYPNNPLSDHDPVVLVLNRE